VLELIVYYGVGQRRKGYTRVPLIGQPLPGDARWPQPDPSTANDMSKALTRWPFR